MSHTINTWKKYLRGETKLSEYPVWVYAKKINNEPDILY